ncbi:Protein ApaG [Zea mays]|uniref:Protein ApaG n=2 Tax=Zea mays TaxID=4577 RepID=A0A3L6FIK5_MAIZE|nr:Protein ApaG [Zea mays]
MKSQISLWTLFVLHSFNSPRKDEEGEEVVRREKEEKAVTVASDEKPEHSPKSGLFVDLYLGIGLAGLQGSSEVEGLAEVLRGEGAHVVPRRLMKKAIEEERFEDAAKYRDELKILAPHSLLKCSSDATTLGIRVQVRSVYIESRSQPLKGQFFFAYRIRITNSSQRPVQLLKRHWIVTDGNGRTENIWGVGVVGEQPVIFPKTGFEYSSACPLSTPNGRMEGDFEMKHIDKAGSSTFNVAFAPFSLSILGDDNDVLL